MWTANPQQFVEDEDDDTFSYSVRISAQDLLLVREQQKNYHCLDKAILLDKGLRYEGCYLIGWQMTAAFKHSEALFL